MKVKLTILESELRLVVTQSERSVMSSLWKAVDAAATRNLHHKQTIQTVTSTSTCINKSANKQYKQLRMTGDARWHSGRGVTGCNVPVSVDYGGSRGGISPCNQDQVSKGSTGEQTMEFLP